VILIELKKKKKKTSAGNLLSLSSEYETRHTIEDSLTTLIVMNEPYYYTQVAYSVCHTLFQPIGKVEGDDTFHLYGNKLAAAEQEVSSLVH